MNHERSNDGLLDGYLTPAETAIELGVAVRTLDRWHLQRVGPPRTELAHTQRPWKPSVDDFSDENRPCEFESRRLQSIKSNIVII